MKISAIILAAIGITLPAAAGTYSGVKSSSPEGFHSRGILMYDNSNYMGSTDQMSHLYMMEGGEQYSEDADFYVAMSALEHGDYDYSIELFKRFVNAYPASIRVPYAWAKIGDCHFFNGRYTDALEAYRNIEPSAFNNDYSLDLNYRAAYSLLKTGERDRAKRLFEKLSYTPRYRLAGLFYDAYTDYANADYEQASRKFAQIPPASELGQAARYYVCQIAFVNGEYDRVIANGRQLVKAAEGNAQYQAEMNRIVGESYYHGSDDDQAGE